MDKLFTYPRMQYLTGSIAITKEPIDICTFSFCVPSGQEWGVAPDPFEWGDQCDQLYTDFLLCGFFQHVAQVLGCAFEEEDAFPQIGRVPSRCSWRTRGMPPGLIPQTKVQQIECNGFPGEAGRQYDERLAILARKGTFTAPTFSHHPPRSPTSEPAVQLSSISEERRSRRRGFCERSHLGKDHVPCKVGSSKAKASSSRNWERGMWMAPNEAR